MEKVKRRLNGKFLALVCAIILIGLSIYKIPHQINLNKLEKLGYDKQAITAIYDKKLKKTIIDNQYYSDFLNQEIVKDDFKEQYIRLYLCRTSLNNDDIELYERLKLVRGYTDEELETLFSELDYTFLSPLLVFDKVDDLQGYISDCKDHFTNNEKSFTLTKNYIKKYEEPMIHLDNKASIETYVSFKTNLENYEPQDLDTIGTWYSISGVKVRKEAAEKYVEMCQALIKNDLGVYAIDGYTSFEDQKKVYDYYAEMYNSALDAEQKKNLIRPGFLDEQLGLSLYITTHAVASGDIDFKNTEEYKWLTAHSHEFGFIFRYPENKKTITGVEPRYNYIRYVGTALATKIHDSGLTFDEYYMRYLFSPSEQ